MVEKHVFQAEIQQLLNIVIHSLYTDKEIFIRELVSNAADALEKLRFTQSAGHPVFESERLLKITVETDEKEHRLVISDTGVGMTHAELVQNLGTIAHSGSKAFLQKLATEKKPDVSLIGQFGVGFYSAFMVATKVSVDSRSYLPEEKGWRWTSDGSGGYEIEEATDVARGTKITLFLKDECHEFTESWRVEEIIKRYSSFIAFPIELNGTLINTKQAIWSRNKNEIKEEEYDEFYSYIGHDKEKPLFRLHFAADAPLAIQALLYVPGRNLEVMGMARSESEVNLYCRRVLIAPKAKALFPDWLRFLKGAVDSEDLPLNISRESMQDTTLMQKLNKVLTTRLIKFLDDQSEKNPENYTKFYKEYSRFLKEGIVTDFTHREPLGKLLRFESSTLPKDEQTSLADYIKRMPSEQKDIYFLLAPSRASAESSPYYEVFAARKYEVLFLSDPWDEFVMEHLRVFEGKTLQPAEKADLTIENPEKNDGELSPDEAKELAAWLKESLGDRVNDVRASERLVGSPVVVVDKDKMLTASMRQMLKRMKQDGHEEPEFKHDLEINRRHAVIVRLNTIRTTNSPLATKVAEQLLDNAKVAAGVMEDPRIMLARLNELLAEVLK
ncbi:MAG: molecular chaperone HtpG [Verrucomicrobia bacterium]|nr:MAG: molecular chaperone HtpG [Verrucomicrobiota bacterium]